MIGTFVGAMGRAMPEPRPEPFPRVVPEVICPACLKRMRMAEAETKPDTIQYTYHCDACGVDSIRLMPLPQQ